MKINVVQKNLIRHLSLLGVSSSIKVPCKAVLKDRHGRDASVRYNATVEVFFRDDDIVVNIVEVNLVLVPYGTEFIVKVSLVDERDLELVYVEAGFVMQTGDTVTLNTTTERPPDAADIIPQNFPETLTDNTIRDIDDLPDLKEWPEYFPGKWMDDDKGD